MFHILHSHRVDYGSKAMVCWKDDCGTFGGRGKIYGLVDTVLAPISQDKLVAWDLSLEPDVRFSQKSTYAPSLHSRQSLEPHIAGKSIHQRAWWNFAGGTRLSNESPETDTLGHVSALPTKPKRIPKASCAMQNAASGTTA